MPRQDPFEGTIGRTHAESTPRWPAPAHPGEEAPNVVVILLATMRFRVLVSPTA